LNHIRTTDVYIPAIFCTAYPHYRRNFDTWFAEAYLIKSSDLRELKEEAEKFLTFERRTTE
jgi:hypothetical protein